MKKLTITFGLAIMIGALCAGGCGHRDAAMEQAWEDCQKGQACLLDGNADGARYFYARAAEAGHQEGRRGLVVLHDQLVMAGRSYEANAVAQQIRRLDSR